jgi:putative sigma-54 modulation protein
MELHFAGRNIEVTEALKTYTTDKLNPLEKRGHRITQIYVTFHIENVTHIAEATAHVNGAEIHASAEDGDMYKAINLMTDKLATQITKLKEKSTHHHD